MTPRCLQVTISAVLLASLSIAEATLVDRGQGLIYDTVLDITWLQDANYAKTSGYSTTGQMTQKQAQIWVEGLVYAGYSDWRLPAAHPINGFLWNTTFSYYGLTDNGFNITSKNNELSHLYYISLGLKGQFPPGSALSPPGVPGFQNGFGIFGDNRTGGQGDIGLFINLQSSEYWTNATGDGGTAWSFYTSVGATHWTHPDVTDIYVWPVRDGDITAVPEVSAYLMLGVGVIGLALTSRTNRRGRRLNELQEPLSNCRIGGFRTSSR